MENISIDEFMKLDIRVVQVMKAESIAGKSKILKLTVELEADEVRTIIAGGAQYYTPEYFVGKKFVALLNLVPRRIGGIESHGMFLAAEVADKPVWLTVEAHVPQGSRIR